MSMFKSVSALSLQCAVVSGANASTNIAVTGITTSDTLIQVLEFSATHYLPNDRTKQCSITSAGYIQCTLTTASDVLWVLWHDASAQGIASPCLKFSMVTADGSNPTTTNIAVTGITTQDTILAVVQSEATTAAFSDETTTTTIPAAGYILCSGAAAATVLWVLWHDASGQGKDSVCLRFTQVEAVTQSTHYLRVPGIQTNDTLLAVVETTATNGIPADRSSVSTIYANGRVKVTTMTAGSEMVVIWMDNNPDRPAYNGTPLFYELVTGSTATAALNCPDIKAADTIQGCVRSTATTGILAEADAGAEVAGTDVITVADGSISLATTNDTGNHLHTLFYHGEAVPDVNPAFNRTRLGKNLTGDEGSIFPKGGFIKGAVMTGAAANTAIACAAADGTTIKLVDTIIMCLELSVTHYLPTDQTKNAYISADGYIKTGVTTDTDTLVVIWHVAGGGSYYAPAVKMIALAGAAAAADITLTGVTTSDTLLFVMHSAATTAAPDDITDETTITDTNDIQASTTDTSSGIVWVWWYDQSVAD